MTEDELIAFLRDRFMITLDTNCSSELSGDYVTVTASLMIGDTVISTAESSFSTQRN